MNQIWQGKLDAWRAPQRSLMNATEAGHAGSPTGAKVALAALRPGRN